MPRPIGPQFDLNNPPYTAGGNRFITRSKSLTPREILKTYRSGDLSAPTKAEQDALGMEEGGTAWHMDINNRNALSLVDSIKSKGFDKQHPVVLSEDYQNKKKPKIEPTIVDGHHRLHASYEVNPDAKIPVVYAKNGAEMFPGVNEYKYDKEKMPEVLTNTKYSANCKACGQRVEKGEGAMLRVPSDYDRTLPYVRYHFHGGDYAGRFHTYHKQHFNATIHNMYTPPPTSGLGRRGLTQFRNDMFNLQNERLNTEE
jgi:hypothetical protein